MNNSEASLWNEEYDKIKADRDAWRERAEKAEAQVAAYRVACHNIDWAHAETSRQLAIARDALEKIKAECDDESYLEWQIAAEALAKLEAPATGTEEANHDE